MRFTISLFAALLLLAATSAASAAPRSTGDKNLDNKLTGLIEGSFLQVQCAVPVIQPKVCNLRRSQSPNPQQLRSQFFGDATGGQISELTVTSPLWGRGKRLQASFETSFQLRTGPEDKPDMQTDAGGSKGTVIPLSLDLYSCGFIYSNNVPHLPVLGTEIKEGAKAEVKRQRLYSDSEGSKLALTEIAQRAGTISVPDGFRQVEQSTVQTFGQRLFVYRTSLEHLTEYTTYKNDTAGKQIAAGTQPVAVPVLDVFVHVQLDGDKVLAGMEYFWDNNLNEMGERKECINATQALMKGREWLFKSHGGSPPLLTVSQIRLGYIQDRKDWTRLVPAWLFDASYSATVADRDTNSMSLSAVNTPFAVNALTGEPVDL
jgi:hypothetical protein